MVRRVLKSLLARLRHPQYTYQQFRVLFSVFQAFAETWWRTSLVFLRSPVAGDGMARNRVERIWFGSRALHVSDPMYQGNAARWQPGFIDEERYGAMVERISRHSMVTLSGSLALLRVAEHLERAGVAGAFVEMGAWKGGMSALMAMAAPSHHIWLFDSFRGLPHLRPEDLGTDFAIEMCGGEGSTGALEPIGALEASVEDAETAMYALADHPRDKTHIIQGWFQETLPQHVAEIGDIALLRLDGDLYESYQVSLGHLWDRVVPGGFVIIDDWVLPGCRKAVEEFFVERKINPFLHDVDFTTKIIQKF